MGELLRTALHCGNQGCGKRCGTAQRGDGYGLTDDDIIVDFRYEVRERSPHPVAWRDSSKDTAAMIYSLTRHANAWPMVWTCQHCRRQVSLDRDRADHVGYARRLITSAPLQSSSDN